MKLIFVAAAACLLLAIGAHAEEPTAKLPGVHDLTPSDFDTVINGRKGALVEFYAPWCGHCKRLTPEFKKLGEKITADPKLASRVTIAKVDADAHRALGERFGVRGFPTLKWFPRGKPKSPEDYAGGRSLDDFLKFINDKIKSDAGFARVEALVPLARRFVATEEKSIIAEAEAVEVPAEDKENAKLYIHYMKKAGDKGMEWLGTELQRLEKLLEKGASARKLEELGRKASVLQSFLSSEEEAAAEEDDDDADDDDDDEPAAAAKTEEAEEEDDDEEEEAVAEHDEEAEEADEDGEEGEEEEGEEHVVELSEGDEGDGDEEDGDEEVDEE